VEVRTLGLTLLTVAAAYVVVVLAMSLVVLPWLRARLHSGAIDGALWVVFRVWLALVHKPTWIGWEEVPDDLRMPPGRGLIVVANHASGIDPFLLQMPLRRRIRWMMSTDQMLPAFAGLWEHLEILPVNYGPQDAATFREAVRHVQGGGILGIFPEGGIARPPGEVRPFLAGVGLLVARSKAPVLLCLIEDAPDASSALAALITPARCRVRCLGLFDFKGVRDTAAIVATLRGKIVDSSHWPANDEALPGTVPAHSSNALTR